MEEDDDEVVVGPREEFQDEVQDESERRRIRARYREIINESTERRDDVECLANKMSEANELFNQVQMAREARLDSQMMNVCATAVTEKAHALHTGFVQFNSAIFVDKIKQHAARLRNNAAADADASLTSADWVNLGREASYLFRRSPAFHFMLGALRTEQPARAARAPRQKKAVVDPGVAKATVPNKVQEMGKSDQETTTEEVERMLSILRRLYRQHGAICYFEFVMHPESFEQTVENIFYVSFLIKDGHASLSLDDNGLPIITPIAQNEDEASSQEAPTIEMALGVSKEEWRDVIQHFNIKKALIPPKD